MVLKNLLAAATALKWQIYQLCEQDNLTGRWDNDGVQATNKLQGADTEIDNKKNKLKNENDWIKISGVTIIQICCRQYLSFKKS